MAQKMQNFNQNNSPITMKNGYNTGVFEWLSKTIETCNSLLQMETTERLIENYKRKAPHDSSTADRIEWMFKVKALKMNYYRWKRVKNFES